MKKKLISILLVVSLIAGLLPATALAADSSGVFVGGVELVADKYYLNTDFAAGTPTGSATNYNAHLAADGTLTIQNLSVKGVANNAHSNAAIYSSAALILDLKGANSLTGADAATGDSAGILAVGSLTIKGGGALSVTGGDAGSNSDGILTYSDMSIESGTVNAIGGAAETGISHGIFAIGSVTITGGVISATGGTAGSDSCGISGAANGVTIKSGTVNATGGTAGGDSHGIYAPSGPVAITGGTVNAIGGTATGTGESCGIYGSSGTVHGVHIEHAVVNATGGASVSDSKGIYGNSVGNYYTYFSVYITGDDTVVVATGGAGSAAAGKSSGISSGQNNVTVTGGVLIARAGAVNGKFEGDDRKAIIGTLDLGTNDAKIAGAVQNGTDISNNANADTKATSIAFVPYSWTPATNAKDISIENDSYAVSASAAVLDGNGSGVSKLDVSAGAALLVVSLYEGTGDSYGITTHDLGGILRGEGRVIAVGGTATGTSGGIKTKYSPKIGTTLIAIGSTAADSYGVAAVEDFTVESTGTLIAIGGTATGTYGASHGVFTESVYSTITNSGKLTAIGGTAAGTGGASQGVCAEYGTIANSANASLTAIGGSATAYSDGVFAGNDGAIYGEFTNNGALTAIGGVAGSSSGIYSYGDFTNGVDPIKSDSSIDEEKAAQNAATTLTAIAGVSTAEPVDGEDPPASIGILVNNNSSFFVNYGTVTAVGGKGTSSLGIYSGGSFSNDGTLTATGGVSTAAYDPKPETTTGSYGIGIGGRGSFDNYGTLTATGGAAGNTSCGIGLGSGIFQNCDGATLTAAGGTAYNSYGVVVAMDGAIRNDGTMYAYAGGAAINSIAVCTAEADRFNSETSGDVVNGSDEYPDATLTAASGEAGAYSFGIRAAGYLKNAGTINATGGTAVGIEGVFKGESSGVRAVLGITNGESNDDAKLNAAGGAAYISDGVYSVGSDVTNYGVIDADGGAATNSYGVRSTGKITNYNSIEAAGGEAEAVSIGVHSFGDLANTGTITAEGGNALATFGVIGLGNITNGSDADSDATLIAEGGTATSSSFGIVISNGALTNYGTVEATGGADDDGKDSYGIHGDLTKGGDITATGKTYGLYYTGTATQILSSGTFDGGTAAIHTEEGVKIAELLAENALAYFDKDDKHVADDALSDATHLKVLPAYTVTLVHNDLAGTKSETKAAQGKPITGLTTPTYAGHVFDGWFTDAELTTAYDFTTPVTGTLTLYAKWTKAHTVIFVTNNDLPSTVTVTNQPDSPMYVRPDDSISEPTPSAEGYTFGGWYEDAAGTESKKVDFPYKVTSDVTFYAKWTKTDSGDQQPPAGGDNTTTGGGGGSATTYPPTITQPEHGRIRTTPTNPQAGDEVTITVTPDDGYEVTDVTVLDRNGKPVEITDNGDGTYTFEQPRGSVNISAEITAVEQSTDDDHIYCPQDDTCPIAKFEDADPQAWYHDAVHYCIANGLMNGTSDTEFEPHEPTTRAMLVTILHRMAGTPAPTTTGTFTDVAEGMWYTDAIDWAASLGIILGHGDGTFEPDSNLTREQMATILYRCAQLLGIDVSIGEDTNILSFDDADEISDWAYPALQWACAVGLYEGDGDGTLRPGDDLERCEMATLIYRLCEDILK